jgi:flagellar protein FliS
MKNALHAYKNTEKMTLPQDADANSVLLVIMEELVKSIEMFQANIDNKTGNNEKKSRGFSKALSIIYTLQTSLDLEKGGPIAGDLFRLYEYARIHIIKDMRKGLIEKSADALNSLKEIYSTWVIVNGSEVSNG